MRRVAATCQAIYGDAPPVRYVAVRTFHAWDDGDRDSTPRFTQDVAVATSPAFYGYAAVTRAGASLDCG